MHGRLEVAVKHNKAKISRLPSDSSPGKFFIHRSLFAPLLVVLLHRKTDDESSLIRNLHFPFFTQLTMQEGYSICIANIYRFLPRLRPFQKLKNWFQATSHKRGASKSIASATRIDWDEIKSARMNQIQKQPKTRSMPISVKHSNHILLTQQFLPIFNRSSRQERRTQLAH